MTANRQEGFFLGWWKGSKLMVGTVAQHYKLTKNHCIVNLQ